MVATVCLARSLVRERRREARHDPRVIPDTWTLDPVPVGVGAAALVLYARAFLTLRRRGRRDHARGLEAGLFAAGVAAAVLALVSPLDALADDTLVSAHMAQHLLIGDVGPLLLLLGSRGPIGFFLLPPPVLRRLARASWLRRGLSSLLEPRVSFAVWACSLAAWHVPQAYDAALAHPVVHRLEHASLFVGGILLWSQIVDPACRRRLTAGRRAALAALALLSGMVLCDVLLQAGPLYAHYAGVRDRPFGLTQATDQDRAGVLMLAEQAVTLGLAAALLLRRHVAQVEQGLRATG